METSLKSTGFFKLPAELRNYIYELVLKPATTAEVPLDAITKPTPPAKILTIVDRQMYHETKKMYRRLYQHFWTSSCFTLSSYDVNRAIFNTSRLANDDLQHVKHISLKNRAERPGNRALSVELTAELLDSRGIWCMNVVFSTPTGLPDDLAFIVVNGNDWIKGSGVTSARWNSEEEARKACDELGNSVSVKEQIIAVLFTMGALALTR